jgi:hypothetical protein
MDVAKSFRVGILTFGTLLSFGVASQIAHAERKVSAKIVEIQENHFEARFDLGKLPIGKSVECQVTLTNTTSKDVLLTDPVLTCSCVAMEIDDEPIGPGESIECKLKVVVPSRPNKSQWN